MLTEAPPTGADDDHAALLSELMGGERAIVTSALGDAG